MINKQEAIDAIEVYRRNMAHILGDNDEKVKTIETCIMLVREAEEAERWIPVSERLPEKKTEVIYSLENHYVSTGYMTDRDYTGNTVELHWEDIESGVLIYPEAWMPLPEPYKEVKDDNNRKS